MPGIIPSGNIITAWLLLSLEAIFARIQAIKKG
jgi:hypothetical protein